MPSGKGNKQVDIDETGWNERSEVERVRREEVVGENMGRESWLGARCAVQAGFELEALLPSHPPEH